MQDGFEWANIILTVGNAAMTALTTWIGYQVWKAHRNVDLPGLTYEFSQSSDEPVASLILQTLNRSDASWVVDKAVILGPDAAVFQTPKDVKAENPWTPALATGYSYSDVQEINWQLAPRGTTSDGLISGTGAASWHRFEIKLPSRPQGFLVVRVSFYSREARRRQSSETLRVKLNTAPLTA